MAKPEKKYIDTLYTYYSSAHINISLVEENLSSFNFNVIKENFYYKAISIKVGSNVYQLQDTEMFENSHDIDGIVLRGLDEDTIPKVPFEIGFKDGFYGRYSNPFEDEPSVSWEEN